VGCNLEQHAARLAEIHRMEIIAIDHRSDVESERDELGANLCLSDIVRCSKRYVMNSSCSHHSGPESGNATQINDGCDLTRSASKPKNARLLAHRTKSECVCKELARQVVALLPESDGINPTN